MSRWTNLNKVRIQNRHETMKHFIVKAMVVKILFNEGYEVYSEHSIGRGGDDDINSPNQHVWKVADVAAYDSRNITKLKIVVEVETKLTKKRKEELMRFYEDDTLYIIDIKGISMDIREMEIQIRHILGM